MRTRSVRQVLSACLLLVAVIYPTLACCPAPRLGRWAVNADQTVIMIWDPAAKRQHFIRQASFKTDTKDFGFLIPSPTQPELAEAGNEAFSKLHQITAPRIVHRPKQQANGGGCGCSQEAMLAKGEAPAPTAEVRVLEEKLVAGFNARVLEADNTEVLVAWLKDNDYTFSPAVAEWAQPYVEQGWKFTALKVAPPETSAENPDAMKTVNASALRLSFDTDRPLFPYREPDYAKVAGDNESQKQQLAAARRMLRIYFLSNARYQGDLTPEQAWTGRAVWSGKLQPEQRTELLTQLQLPAETGPAEFHLTEFEDQWPYKVAPADVYFAAAKVQDEVRRPDVYVYRESGSDVSLALLIATAFVPLLWPRRRKV
jgi:hypothetical protein